jgi:N-acetylglucosaminyldiphosphoundecaprenol N-acetyl-beta-D-mannosaminyltransferase
MLKEYFEKIYCDGYEYFVNMLEDKLLMEEKAFVVTANPETLMIGTENEEFDKILKKKTTIIVPDGIGVVKAGNILNYNINERITGVDIVTHLLESANKYNKSIYFLGAKEQVISTLVEKVNSEYPNINVLGYKNGYVSNKDMVFEDMVNLKPDIVLVALGIPVQELLIDKHYDNFEKGIFIGVGGSFDVISGIKKRAPKIFIKLNIEWLYRIAKEPKRFSRFYKSNIKFISEIKKIKG